jgi:hypothetical protein
MVLGTVTVLSEHDVNVAGPLVRPSAGHIVSAMVGAEVAAQLDLPLSLEDGEPDGARRRPLGEVALRPRQLDVVVEQRSLRRDRATV